MKTMRKLLQRPSSALLCICTLALVSCTTATIKEDARDRDSSFRGFWSLTFMEPPSVAPTSAGRFKCWDMEGFGNLQIAGGRAVARVHGYDLSGFVDTTGQFTTSLNLKENYQFIFNGQLDATTGKGTGRLYHVRKDLGTQGCSSKVELEKSEI
jgi:hypothetical protein